MSVNPTPEQLRMLGALMSVAQMFETHTARRPDAAMIPGSFFGSPSVFPLGTTQVLGLPVYLGDRLALIYGVDVPGGSE